MSLPITVHPRKTAGAICLLLLLNPCVFGQAAPDPQREQLLNGLRVLLSTRPGNPDVLVKLRIHSGAAFDLAGKAGEMALLGDMLFPDKATIEYFTTEEMGGKLDVNANYDSITVTMQGRASQFEQMIQLLRNALLSTQFTPETVARLRAARIRIVQETAISPAIVADRAIARRLFGDFPYGRPLSGSPEDLARVERGDLMLARDRFLNSNNATLAVVGGVEKARALRALRQLLGAWRKSEQIVPTTFRQPQAPDARTLIISGPTDQTAEVRIALRGLSRSDPDFYAAAVLAAIAKHRLEQVMPELAKKPLFVRSEARVMPGMFVLGIPVNNANVAETIAAARKVLDALTEAPPTSAELEQAKGEMATEVASLLAKAEGTTDAWLDLDTYRLPPVNDQLASLRAISAADIQRVATRLFHQAAIASVVVGDSQQLKTALQGRLQVEVIGEIVAPAPSASPKPQGAPPKKPGVPR
jgi:zinc protease